MTEEIVFIGGPLDMTSMWMLDKMLQYTYRPQWLWVDPQPSDLQQYHRQQLSEGVSVMVVEGMSVSQALQQLVKFYRQR